jgi:hypothetical protein
MSFYITIGMPIARWPFQTWPVVVDPVVDWPEWGEFQEGA